MFTCSRLVDKATTDDDLPPPGMCLAEAIQLCRDDQTNIQRIVRACMKKLSSNSVNVRIKALRLLSHIASNGPSVSVQNEIKLYSSTISDCIGWRGQPHPVKGYEPYQEMKDAAQQLLDMIFMAQTFQATSSSQFNVAKNGYQQENVQTRVGGFNTMESYGNGQYLTQAVSLEPVNHDPNAHRTRDNIVGFFNRTFGKETAPTRSKYGSSSNVQSGSQYASQPVIKFTYQQPIHESYGQQPQQPGFQTYQQPMQQNYQQPMQQNYQQPMQQNYQQEVYAPPPPQRGQFQRLEADVSWSNKKPSNPIAQRQKAVTDTPAKKFMKITGGRALPTNGEISTLKSTITPESIDEFIEGLENTDWKVKVRAVYGLEVAGEKYGIGTVASTKNEIEKLKSAPQASLRSSATRFYASIENVEPEPVPETPSAFTFTNEKNTNSVPEDDGSIIDFSVETEETPVVVTEEKVGNEKEEKEEKEEELQEHQE